jgi:predicted Zn-dependent protease
MRPWLSALLVLTATGPSAGASAQGPGAVPREVVIYVHEDMPNTDFVEPLVCALGRVLVAPVRAEKRAMPIDIGLMGSSSELSSEKVLGRLYQQTGPYAGTVMFLLVPYPILSGGRPVFGANFGPPYNRGVVSIADLEQLPRDAPPAQRTDIVVRRAYKVLLRYVGQIGGLWNRNDCVMKMPHGLDQLDAKSRDFCEDDRAALVAAGVVRGTPAGNCSTVISRR